MENHRLSLYPKDFAAISQTFYRQQQQSFTALKLSNEEISICHYLHVSGSVGSTGTWWCGYETDLLVTTRQRDRKDILFLLERVGEGGIMGEV